MKEKFIFLPHTADIKFQAYGQTLSEIFENSVLAVSSYISGNKKIENKKAKIIEVKGDDLNSLFYNFLDELLYLLDAESFIAAKASVLLRGNNLRAELYGDDTTDYELTHIKAATYAEMYIKKVKKDKEEYWEAQAVLDV